MGVHAGWGLELKRRGKGADGSDEGVEMMLSSYSIIRWIQTN